MPDLPDPVPNPETPWEFLNDDGEEAEAELGAEDAALHIETPGQWRRIREAEPEETVVHYMEDEHPEIADESAPRKAKEVTGDVEDLLIRQHYLPPDSK